MKRFRLFIPIALQLVLLACAVPSWAADFTQADLEKMVKELDAIIPQNENYAYPVKSSVVNEDQLNAYVTLRKEEGSKKPRAVMVVYSGLIKAANGDPRIIRAVIAHELSHLSLGHHVDINPKARDVKNLWIRQQEFEADMAGAIALQKMGKSKQDMCDMLLFLAKSSPGRGDWLNRLVSDHADPKARAAEVATNPMVLKALVTFDTGLAYFDNRNFNLASQLFDLAAIQEPALTEAYINSAKSLLYFYYDNLPQPVRDVTWWRPDLGPLLTNPELSPKPTPELTEEDRERYADAMAKINIAIGKAPNNVAVKELLALAQVLEPDAKKDVVMKGVEWFKTAAAGSSDPGLKLRYANNAGVGYQRTGDLQSAYDLIMNAQKGTDLFNPALGENLGRVIVKGRSTELDKLAAAVLYTWLLETPSSSPNWGTVKATYEGICNASSLKVMEIKQKPTYLCTPTTLVTGGKELGLLLPTASFYDILGKADLRTTFTDRFPDLSEIRWNGGNIAVFTEREHVMRITTYEPGSYLVLQPKDKTLTTKWNIRVGMTQADLDKILNPKAGVKTDLARGGKTEEWVYFPALQFGVYMLDGVVKGLTVTPIKGEA